MPSESEDEKKRVTAARDEWRKLTRAYAGFQMATALFVSAKAGDVCGAAWVVGLFAISIPATIAFGGLVRITEEDKLRNPGSITFLCGSLAFIPSIAALSLLLWPGSHLAAMVFPVMCFIWLAVIVRLRTRQDVHPLNK
jgi:hypothetical protein